MDDEPLAIRLMQAAVELMRLSGCTDQLIERELEWLGSALGVNPAGEGCDEEEFDEEPSANRNDVRWACEVLGVETGASQEEIKQAYRKKMTDLHPDKYANLPEVVQKLIKEKAQELNRARDILRA